MRKKYDFSKGERGKFYRPDAGLTMSVYLDEEVIVFTEDIANKKNADFSSVAKQKIRATFYCR